jgi:hypothetical protein
MTGDVDSIVSTDVDVLCELAKSGFSAMHYACACRQRDVASAIISKCGGAAAHVRASNDMKSTPFQICLFNGCADMLGNGAFASHFSGLYSEKELADMREIGNARMLHWWAPPSDRWAGIVAALDADDVDAVELLKCMGVERNEAGVSAMWCACAMGKSRIASAMLCHLRGRDLEEALFSHESRLGTCAFFMMLASGMDELCVSVFPLITPGSPLLRDALKGVSKSGHTCADVSVHCSESVQRLLRSL